MIVRALAVLFAGCLVGACSLGALDGFSGGQDPVDAAASETGTSNEDGGGGGGGTDSATPDDAGASGDTGTTDPYNFSDGFEGSGSCTPWTSSRTNAETVSPGRSGVSACRACTTENNGGGIQRLVRPKPPATTLPAGLYTFRVWVRDATYTGTIAFELYELTASLEKGPYRGGQPKVLTSTWAVQEIEYFAPNPVPGFRLDLYVDNGPPVNTCFSADDASLVYTP